MQAIRSHARVRGVAASASEPTIAIGITVPARHPGGYDDQRHRIATRQPATGMFRSGRMAVVLRLVFWVWCIGAVFAGRSLLLQRIPPLAVQGIVLGLTAVLLLAYLRVTRIREQIDALELRSLVLLHLTRFVGIYFLVLHQRGDLPRELAVPAGLGDIAVATMVLPVVYAPLDARARLRAITIWNVVGLVDILLVVGTFTRINLTDPVQLRPFTELPLSMLPTFLVPLIIASHVVIFVRAARERSGQESG